MLEKQFLMIPGPTPVPPKVLRELSHPMINHRGPEFSSLMQEIFSGLKEVFKTKNHIIIYPASGTGAMEASIVNTLSPSDKVLAVSIGAFGDRYAKIASDFGANVIKCDFTWGEAADVEKIKEILEKEKDIKAVLITHNETSTGVTNPLEEISKIVKKYDVLLLVDAISSLGAIELKTDQWQIDCVVAGSQKALMLPPGISFVSISEKAWEYHKNAKMPRHYFDWSSYKKWMEKNQTPYTPALPQLFGLKTSLKILLDEIGLENNFKRHKILRDAVREGVKAIGLELLARDEIASPSVTAIKSPEGIDVKNLRKIMREKYNVITAGGQGKLEDKIFRIGHLGFVDKTDIIATLFALEMSLSELGYKFEKGASLKKAEEILNENF
jgi:aspartate aminotransferase-like enzyme